MRPLILMPTINSRNSNACYLQLLSVQRCQHPPQAERSCWAGFRLVLTRKGIDAMCKAYKKGRRKRRDAGSGRTLLGTPPAHLSPWPTPPPAARSAAGGVGPPPPAAALCCWGGRDPPPSSSALPVGGAGISVYRQQL